MEKPISVVLEELKQDIINSINNTNLPICIIEPIIKDLYNEIAALSRQQLLKDKEEYEKSQKEEIKK